MGADLPRRRLVVIGVHTPEFSFEHELDAVQQGSAWKRRPTGTTSGRPRQYLGSARSENRAFAVKDVTIPVGVSTFADELYRVPRSWAEQAHPNLVTYNQHDRGGHFAAWEQPQLLSDDVRATFRSLR